MLRGSAEWLVHCSWAQAGTVRERQEQRWTLSGMLSDGDTWSWRHPAAGRITPTGGQHVSGSSCAILQLPSCSEWRQTFIPPVDLNLLICVVVWVASSPMLLHSLSDPCPWSVCWSRCTPGIPVVYPWYPVCLVTHAAALSLWSLAPDLDTEHLTPGLLPWPPPLACRIKCCVRLSVKLLTRPGVKISVKLLTRPGVRKCDLT